MNLSLCMIVKNEEAVLERCLNSVVGLFDEIIIVDTGSTDKTKEIASSFTSKIFDFKWIDNFAAARNYAFGKASSKYLMWLDADDVIEKDDLDALCNLKKQLADSDVDIYMMKYNTAFDEEHNPIFSFFRERIVRKGNVWIDRIHEFIPLNGKIKRLDTAVTHQSNKHGKSKRNLNIYQQMQKDGEKFSTRNLFYYGRELVDHKNYKKAITILKKFLATEDGWIEDIIQACIDIYGCYCGLEQDADGVAYLYQTFSYDLPRKKTCCLIGNYFLNHNKLQQAIYWYGNALSLPAEGGDGFHEGDFDLFIPYLNLCVCYDKLGDSQQALAYHRLSAMLKPMDKAVLLNEAYFEKLK